MRIAALAAFAVLLCAIGWAQQGGLTDSGYYALEVRHIGHAEFNLGSGGFKFMEGGADLVFRSKDPANDLPVRAQRIDFTYANPDDPTPSRIVLQGNVVIEHSEGTIRAAKADINFQTGDAVFTGSPKLDSARAKGLESERIVLNLNTQDVTMEGMSAKQILLEDPEASAADKMLLSDSDVTDWTAFINTFKREVTAEEPSAGKHLASLLDENIRRAVIAVSAENLLRDRAGILKQLNTAVQSPALYDAAIWPVDTLPADVRALAELGPTAIGAEDLLRLNRALLHVAYPELVKPLAG